MKICQDYSKIIQVCEKNLFFFPVWFPFQRQKKLSRYGFFQASRIGFTIYFIDSEIQVVVNCTIILYTMKKGEKPCQLNYNHI